MRLASTRPTWYFLLGAGLAVVLLPATAPAQSAARTGTAQDANGAADSAPPDQPSTTVREQVVVTATRIEQSLDTVPVSVTVLERSDLEATASLSAADNLLRVPGFSLFRRASSLVAHPTAQGLSLRGIGPSGVSRTLVLLDGIPMNDDFGGWVYWSRVPQAPLERVEIVRGGGSSVWGNYALGGVVQLMTADPRGDFARVHALAGERETGSVDASAGWRLGDANLSVRGAYFDTGGYKTIRADQRGAIDIPADSRDGNLAAKARFGIGDRSAVTLSADYFDEERSNGTPLTGNGTQATHAALVANLAGAGGGQLDLSLFWAGQDFDSTFSSQAEDRESESPALDQFLVDSESLALGAGWRRGFDSGSTAHTLGLGSDVRFVDGTTNEDFRNLGAGFTRRRKAGGKQTLGGLYVQDNLSLGTRVRLNVGARVDTWRTRDGMRFEQSLENGSTTLDDVYDDRDQTEVSPKVAVLFAATDSVSLQGSVYRAFRAPTINELFRPFRVRNDITEANPELVPEELQGAELGLDYRRGSSSFHLTGFWNEVDDPIANVTIGFGPGVRQPCGFVPGGGSCRQRQNLGQTRIQGLEAELAVRPAGSPWSGSLSYLLSDPEVRSAPAAPELEGKRLAQVPENTVVARIEYVASFSVALQGRWVGEQFEDDLNERPLAEFTTVDLYAARDLGSRWQVFAAVENVFDETIEVATTADGLVTIGGPRLVHGGVRYRWQQP